MTARTAVVLCCLVLGAAACESKPDLREWTPDDHGHPPDPASAPTAPAEAPSPQTIARAAAALYRVSCAPCHGAEGRGDGPNKPPGASLASFADPAWQKARTDEELAAAIRAGKGLMPAFGDRIIPDGITALVAHLRTFGAAETGTAADAPAPAR